MLLSQTKKDPRRIAGRQPTGLCVTISPMATRTGYNNSNIYRTILIGVRTSLIPETLPWSD